MNAPEWPPFPVGPGFPLAREWQDSGAGFALAREWQGGGFAWAGAAHGNHVL